MTTVRFSNVMGAARGEPVQLVGRRRRLATVLRSAALPVRAAGRPFIVSVHRSAGDDPACIATDATVRLRRDWNRTLVGPRDVVLITYLPRGGGGGGGGGKGVGGIALGLASIALIALAPYAAPALLPTLVFGTTPAFVLQAGMVIGGIALGAAAQNSSASNNKTKSQYSVSGGGNLPRPGARKPLLYGRSWSAPPLSQQDFFTYDGDVNVLTKRMTLGLGKFRIHKVRSGETLFWSEDGGIQAPYNAITNGPLGTAIEFLYESASTIAPGDAISSPEVAGQELPRPGGNPEWSPWFRLTPQGVTATAFQMNWTYPSISRTSTQGRQVATVAGVLFQGQRIDPDTGAAIGAPFELWRSQETNALTSQALRRTAAAALPVEGAYRVRGQNLYPEPVGFVQENRATWDSMTAFKADPRIRRSTTEIVMRVRAGAGIAVTSFSDVMVEASRIVPVWTGGAWVEQVTSKAVWAYADLVRAEHGLAQADGFDTARALHYAGTLDALDTFDGPLPEVSSFWEAAGTVLHPMRADPVKVGAVHSFVRDESRNEPRHVLTRRQIVADSASTTFNLTADSGDVIVEFSRDGDPKRPDEARFSYGERSRTPKRYRVEGIRDGVHAMKHATWLAAVGVFRGEERKITTEWDGRLVYPGDHILSDVWFLKGTQTFGVVAASGNVLRLDARAALPADWGYGSIRTRAGREWGILRMRGAGLDAIELHPGDVAALSAATQKPLSAVLARATQDPTTVVLGELVELQRTFVARAAIPSDADHVQIEMVNDDPRVWQLLDETVFGPVPIDGSGLEEPLIPTISVLHARCERIETGIEVIWGVSITRGARNYEADLSYNGGRTWEVLSSFGPASSGRAQMRQSDDPVTVRARAFGRTGLPGPYKSATFYTVAPVVDGRQTSIVYLPPIDYAGLGAELRAQIDHIREVEAYAGQISAQARADFAAALARADAVSVQAGADFAAAQGRADAVRVYAEGVNATALDALRKAAQSLDNDAINQAAMVAESSARLTAEAAATMRLDGALSRLGSAEGSIVTIAQTQATDRAAFASQVSGINAFLFEGSNPDGLPAVRAGLVEEKSARATSEAAIAGRIEALTSSVSGNAASIAEERTARSTAVSAQAAQILDLSAALFDPNVPTGLPATRASVVAETQARVDAIEATARRLDGLSARIDGHSASIFEEATVRGSVDGAFARQISDINATLFDPAVPGGLPAVRASVTTQAQVSASADEALSGRIEAVRATAGGNTSAILAEQSARAAAIEATARRLDGLSARIDDNSASIINEATVRGSTDGVYARQIGDINAVLFDPSIPYGLPAASARITTEAQARVDGDGALASRLTSLTAQTDSDRAYFLSEQQTRIGKDNALASDVASLYTQTANNTSSITSQAKSITDIYKAQAETNNDLYARSDAGTAFGRFSMQAISGVSGVTARVQAIVASERNGQTKGGGFYMDLLPNGQVRTVFDTNYFYITSNGQAIPAFQFDGNLLTIPALRVTQQLILPGAASDKVTKTIETFDCGSVNDKWREVPGTQISFNVDTDTGFGVVFTVATDLYVEANGTNQTYVSCQLETAIAINGNPYNNRATNIVTIGGGGGTVTNNNKKQTGRIGEAAMEIFGTGQITLSLMYRFSGSAAGVKGSIVYAQTKALIVKR